MNARQAAKAASIRIEQLEDFNRRCSRDIKAYNKIIDEAIDGTVNFCDWCDEQPDCAPIDQGHGCKNWVLKFDLPDEKKGDDEKNDGTREEAVTEAVSLTGSTGRT